MVIFGLTRKKDTHFTPLLYACRSNDPAIINRLLDSNADINDKGKHGETALHVAAKAGADKVLSYLIEDLKMSVHCATDLEITPITVAVSEKHHECTRILLNHNAIVNHKGVVSIFFHIPCARTYLPKYFVGIGGE